MDCPGGGGSVRGNNAGSAGHTQRTQQPSGGACGSALALRRPATHRPAAAPWTHARSARTPPPPNAPERAHRTASACTVLAKRSAGCTGPLPGCESPAQCRQLRPVGRPTVQWANAPVAKLCTGCTAMRRAAQGLAPHTPAHPVRAVKHRLPFALHLLHTLRQNTSAIAQRLLRALFLQNGFLRCMCVRVRAHSAVRPCALLKLGLVVPLRLL